MQFLIPTRNNPVALAGLLSSILHARFDATAFFEDKDTLILMDGSNEPVITDPHLSRLLPMFHLQYRHFISPHVNAQRLEGLRQCSAEEGPVLILDDDLVMLRDPTPAFALCSRDKCVLFGTVVDALNDRRYPDYERVSGSPSIHAFYNDPGKHLCARVHAKPGCMMFPDASAAYARLSNLHLQHPKCPAVADDAWAQMMSGPTPWIHSALMFLHVGNRAQWWSQGSIKHTAVEAVLKANDAK